MQYFKKIIQFALPYKRFAFLNIIFNVFYALFSALSFIALIPMLDVLFEQDKIKAIKEPTYTGMLDIKDYFKDYLSFKVHDFAQDDASRALLLVISLVILLFLLKNIFRYLAMYAITFLRNGVLKDMRNELYDKVISLPIAYYSEKRKGDTMSRISTDVLEIQHSFLSILELIIREPLMILFTIVFCILHWDVLV